MGIYIDGSTNRITSVECALRSAKYFYTTYIRQVNIESGRFKIGNAIYVKAY